MSERKQNKNPGVPDIGDRIGIFRWARSTYIWIRSNSIISLIGSLVFVFFILPFWLILTDSTWITETLLSLPDTDKTKGVDPEKSEDIRRLIIVIGGLLASISFVAGYQTRYGDGKTSPGNT